MLQLAKNASYSLFLGFLLSLAIQVQAQQKWIPLIEELNATQAGTERYGALAVDICWELSEAEPDSASYYGSLGLITGKEIMNDSIVVRALLGLSVVDSYKGKHAEAIEKSFEALRLAEVIQDTIAMADAVNNIGIDMYYQGDFESALKYYQLYGDYAVATNNLNRYANALNNMAMIEEELGNSEQEVAYYLEAIQIFDEIDEDVGYINTKVNLATTYANMGKHQEAYEIYEEAYDYFKEVEFTSALGELLTFWGDLYFKEQQYKKALEKLEESLAISIETNNALQEMFAYEVLHEVYFELGNLDKAYSYFQKYHQLLLESREEQKLATIEELRAAYDTEKKEQEIARLEQENQISELRAQQDAQTRWLLIIGLIAAFIIALLLYSRIRNKTKTNALLDAKNQELANLNKTKDRLFSIISHDLKSPLSSFHLITKSLTDNLDHLEKDQLREYLESLRDSSANVRDMMDNLLRWALTQTDQLYHHMGDVEVNKVLNEVISQLGVVSSARDVNIQTELEEELKIHGDVGLLEIVIRNLLSNSLKFTSPGKSVKVQARKEGDRTVLRVSDEGVGMDQQEVERLLAGEIIGAEIQNSTEKGTGLGITLVKELVKKMEGELAVTTEKGKGTTFELFFNNAA